MQTSAKRRVTARYIGGPTAVLEYGGLRILTDPTFDAPRSYEVAPGRRLVKTIGPSAMPEELGAVDVVLLSHEHHVDNLDTAGRAFLPTVSHVLTTVAGGARLGEHAKAMPRWSSVEIDLPEGGTARVTSVPAQHGSDGTDHLTGEVTGFYLQAEGYPTVYVSGDNASLDVVRTISERLGKPDVALIFAGAARTALVPQGTLTLTSDEAAEAVDILGVRSAMLLHFEAWEHFTEGRDALERAFQARELSEQFVIPRPGDVVNL